MIQVTCRNTVFTAFLSTASGLFLIAAGLSLIFGVTRIINIAHGSLDMLGTYIAYSFLLTWNVIAMEAAACYIGECRDPDGRTGRRPR